MDDVDVHAELARQVDEAARSRHVRSPAAASPATFDSCAGRPPARRRQGAPATPRAPAAAGRGRASTGIAPRRVCLADVLELVDARWRHEALEAEDTTPGERARANWCCPGTTPPQRPTSTWQRPRAAAALASKPSTLVVAGMLLSGMSTIVVTPPAAAARVPVSKPSQSVLPGSLMCTWVSTSPGRTTRSPTSTTRTPAGRSPWAPTAAMRPSRTETAAAGRAAEGRRVRIDDEIGGH